MPSASVSAVNGVANVLLAEWMGARIVGYYDYVNTNPTTVDAFLQILSNQSFNTVLEYRQDKRNTYIATLAPPVTSYNINTKVNLVIANTSTVNSPTLNINGVGAGFINLPDGLPLLPGDIQQNMIASFQYDTVTGGFQLLNPAIGRRKPSVASSVYVSGATNWGTTTAGIKVNFDTVEYDPFSLFDASSKRFIANYAGYYRISSVLAWFSFGGSGANFAIMYILKNGSLIKRISGMSTLGATNVFSGDVTLHANTNDYFEIWILKSDAVSAIYANDNIGGTSQECSQFVFEYLGT